jgi:hypothetical protein
MKTAVAYFVGIQCILGPDNVRGFEPDGKIMIFNSVVASIPPEFRKIGRLFFSVSTRHAY